MALGGGGRGALQPWMGGKRLLSPGGGRSPPRLRILASAQGALVKVWERGEQRGAALTPDAGRDSVRSTAGSGGRI